MLRKKLAEAQTGAQDPVEEKAKPIRIDSVDRRETILGGGQRSAWLSERDVEFFTGSGANKEEDATTNTAEYKSTVQRRLLIGGLLTLGAGAFALVPTEALRPKPPKPMYFYLVPVLRVQELLGDCKQIIEDADWAQLRQALARIEGPPNNIRQSIDSVIALVPDTRAAAKVQDVSSDFLEYLESLDYQKYFDAMPVKAISGAQNAQYATFSLSSLKAAQGKLAEVLALVPQDQLQMARDQMSAGY